MTEITREEIKAIRSKASDNGCIPPHVLQALRDGDHDAFRQVYVRWRKPIYNLLYKLTGSTTEADDITQDVFVNLWEIRTKIDPGKNIRTYLYLVARQSAIKHFQKQKARSNYATYTRFDDIDMNTSYDIIVAKEIELLKELALSRMPKQRQHIYNLYYNEGLTNDEIASQLQITKESVYNQLSIARRDLREILALVLFLLFQI